MRYGFLASVTFAALVVAAPLSFAFEIQPTAKDSGTAANFANNPDSASDSMSANLAGGSNSAPALHFGNSTLQFTGGNGGRGDSYGMSPAYREEFMGGPDQIGSAVSPR